VRSGIKLVASLPDDWIAPLIHAVDKDDRFKHVPSIARNLRWVCARGVLGGIPFSRHHGGLRVDDLRLCDHKNQLQLPHPVFTFATLRA